MQERGTRLSFIQTVLVSAENGSIKTSPFHSKLPDVHRERESLEWTMQTICRVDETIGKNKEQLNIVMTVSKAQFFSNEQKGESILKDKSIPFEGVHLVTDINTSAENDSQRFIVKDIQHFFAVARKYGRQIIEGLDNLL